MGSREGWRVGTLEGFGDILGDSDGLPMGDLDGPTDGSVDGMEDKAKLGRLVGD